MEPHAILEELIRVLELSGVTVRREPLEGSGGGLCKIKDEWILFLDADSQSDTLIPICSEALARVVDMETIYIKPEVRRFITTKLQEP